MSSVAIRRICASGVCQRITSGTNPGTRDGSESNWSKLPPVFDSPNTPPEIEFRVVSLPPIMSRIKFPMNSMSSMACILGSLAINVMKSGCSSGSRNRRSSHNCLNSLSISNIPALRSSSGKAPPTASLDVARSDHAVSFRRSSNGKSKRVASICVVSSTDTRSTQLNGVRSGRSSSN